MIDAQFIRDLGVIIIAAAVFGLGARRLRLPTIVAYLIAGLLLGPGVGLVTLSDSLELISETGIVLLLFLVGLELSLDKIKGVGMATLVAGLIQVGFTLAGGFAVCRLLGLPKGESLFLALALTFSSTVVAVKLLEEKHEFNRLHGRIAVGILLLQDMVVIFVLTLMDGMQAGARPDWSVLLSGLGRAFGGMAVLLALVLGASRLLLPRAFAWAARFPETLLIWSLCWCFFIVAGALGLGLSPESGGFLAGVSLAQLPYNHDLRRRVHPLMHFFIAVFFVALGIRMNWHTALTLWPAALVLTLFVLAGKFIVVMWTLARMKFDERTAHHTASALAQVSEFSFVLMAAAAGAGWVEEQTTSLVGLVGLATLSIGSCWIVSNERVYAWMRRLGLLRIFGGTKGKERAQEKDRTLRGHVIVVGMNTLGRMLARRLHERGEVVLAIDTDPGKLKDLPCPTMLGNVEYLPVLEEAGISQAKLLVSALRIEPTNDLLAYRCQSAGIPCGIHVVDLSVVDNLLAMDVDYLMIPKIDGIKLQSRMLREQGTLKT